MKPMDLNRAAMLTRRTVLASIRAQCFRQNGLKANTVWEAIFRAKTLMVLSMRKSRTIRSALLRVDVEVEATTMAALFAGSINPVPSNSSPGTS